MKKQSLGSCWIFFCSLVLVLLLISNSTAATRLLLPSSGEGTAKKNTNNGFLQALPELKMEDDDGSVLDLMGIESCGKKDEECLKRRMIAEAHLDYIYTQHHKP